MKKILVVYSDDNMKYSRKFLAIQARMLGVFDKIFVYKPNILPSYIKESPLMKYKRGGGYWAWKPCVIWETLQKVDDGDIVCYIDAGCTLHKGKDWNYYFSLMEKYDTLCFKYQDEIVDWNKYGQTKTQIKYWSKKNTLIYFDRILGSEDYRSFNKIFAAVILCKGKNNKFVKDWLDITINHPELVLDPNEEEKKDQYDFFCGNHRHDQSIITPLAYKYMGKTVCILPEKFDVAKRDGIIVATRIKIASKKIFIHLFIYYILHFWNEKKWYKVFKAIFKK